MVVCRNYETSRMQNFTLCINFFVWSIGKICGTVGKGNMDEKLLDFLEGLPTVDF